VDLKVIPGGAAGPPRQSRTGNDPGIPRRLFGRRADPPAGIAGPFEAGLRPVDLLVLLYLGITTCLMIAFQGGVRAWGALALGHMVAGALILRVAGTEPPRNAVVRFFRDFYPLLLMIFFYEEYSWLTHLSGGMLHDARVVAWDQKVFGFQPSQELHKMWPWKWLSEYLHAAYFVYYLVPVSLTVTLYASGKWASFQESVTTILLAFLTCGLLFIAFPVAGPYHHFGAPSLGALAGPFARLTHGVVERASSVGTAFPSSHTAVAVAVWVSALRLSRRMFWALSAVVPALALGTVYGGFHYGVDTLAGGGVGVLAGIVGPRVHGFFVQRLPRSRHRPSVTWGAPLPKTGGRA
jgi:membrane-associated phospholipid phosphatase